jgi:hypothetical protein
MRSRRRAIGRTTAIMLVIGAVLAGSLAIAVTTQELASNATTTTSAQGTTTGSCVTESPATLSLSLSLNSSSIRAGHDISFNASLFNTSCAENDVPTADNWAVPDFVIAPAGPTDSPVAFAVVQGFYVPANVSSAPRIEYGPGGTTVAGGIKSYSFQPKSDVASIRSINGYWSKDQFLNFTPGAYTVVVADEWGHVATSSFTVQG